MTVSAVLSYPDSSGFTADVYLQVILKNGTVRNRPMLQTETEKELDGTEFLYTASEKITRNSVKEVRMVCIIDGCAAAIPLDLPE